MFGIGYQEMILIGVVALLIFGPQRLPEMAGQVGRWVRDFRRMSADLTSEFESAMSEVDDVKKSVQREFGAMSKEVAGVSRSVEKDLGGKKKQLAAGTRPAAKTGTARAIGGASGSASRPLPARKGTTSSGATIAKTLAARTPVATKEDPLADVSFLDDSFFTAKNGHGDEAVALDAANGATDVDPALIRMRQRRAAAGYRRG